MSNISSQHDILLKQKRDTGAGETPPLFDPQKETSPWAWSDKVIPQAVLPAFWLLPRHISQHTHICLNAHTHHWGGATTVQLSSFSVSKSTNQRSKNRSFLSSSDGKESYFEAKKSHWWSFPLKLLIAHQCEASRYYKKKNKNQNRISS